MGWSYGDMRQPRISDLDTRCSERFERESRLREKMRLGETTWGSAARARLSKGIGGYEMNHLMDKCFTTILARSVLWTGNGIFEDDGISWFFFLLSSCNQQRLGILIQAGLSPVALSPRRLDKTSPTATWEVIDGCSMGQGKSNAENLQMVQWSSATNCQPPRLSVCDIFTAR